MPSSFFQPSLPSKFKTLLNSMTSGLLNKVFLLFDHVFWNTSIDMYHTFLPKRLFPPHTENGDWLIEFVDLYRMTGQPILMVLMAIDAGEAIERSTDSVVQDVFKQHFSQVFKESNFNIIKMKVTRWKSDPFSRGSYMVRVFIKF